MLLCRNIIVNFYAPLMKEPSMSVVVDEILNTYSQLYKTLGDAGPSNMTNAIGGN